MRAELAAQWDYVASEISELFAEVKALVKKAMSHMGDSLKCEIDALSRQNVTSANHIIKYSTPPRFFQILCPLESATSAIKPSRRRKPLMILSSMQIVLNPLKYFY